MILSRLYCSFPQVVEVQQGQGYQTLSLIISPQSSNYPFDKSKLSVFCFTCCARNITEKIEIMEGMAGGYGRRGLIVKFVCCPVNLQRIFFGDDWC